MKIAETFECPIIDEYGGSYPNAIVAILDGHEYSNRGFHADDIGSELVFESSIDGVSYEVMYYYGEDFVGKYRSRPLKIKSDEGFTTSIPVDMEHVESEQIQHRAIDPDEKIIQLIKADLIRRFTPEEVEV